MALQVPSTVSFITVDTTSPKTLQLPLTTNRIGRILTIKDRTGLAATNPITIQTQGGDTFQNAVTSYRIDVAFGSATFVARSGQWILQQGTQNIQASSINARFYFGDGSSLTNLPAISSLSLLSTVTGLGSANYVSTLSLISTTNSIGAAISSFSTAFGPGGIALSNITSTVAGLGSAGYVSSASLLNLVSTPNLLNLVSTQGLSTILYSTITSLASFGYISSTQLTSTVRGLGTAGYASTSFVGSAISSLSSIYASTFGTQNANISSLTTSSIFFGIGDGFLSMPDIQPFTVSTFLINTSSILAVNPIVGNVSSLNALRFWGLTGGLNNTAIAEVSTGAGTQELLFFKGSSVSDQIRFQTTGIIEFETGVSSRLWPNAPQNPIPAMIINTSSNVGIQTANPGATLDVNGTARAIILSSQQLFVSSINGAAPINSSFIQSTVIGLGSVGYVSTLSLISTTLGLQQSGFVSSPNLLNLVSTPNLLNLVSTQNLLNLVSTQNLLGLVSTPNLLNLVSTPNLLNLVSTPNLLNLVSTQGLSTTLYSTITSLASFGYISSLQLLSTTRGSDNQLISTAAGLTLTISSFVDPNELASTVIGLGSAGFISSLALDARLASTTMGLGSAGYLSTASLVSTTLFFQTAGFVSSPNLLNHVSTQGLSTVLYSTITSLATFGYISTSQLTSTVAGLASGSAAPPFISAFTVSTGSLNASSITASTLNVAVTSFISALTVNSLQFGDGTGWVNIGPIEAVAISSIQENTNTLYANNALFGTASTQTALQFFGLQGNYNNTVLAEVSTGTGTQEFLVFKGSSVSDRIRMQTTGSIVFEPGVSSRLWNSNTVPTLSNATPAMVINTSSNVGIQTATPGATLDVAGTGRAITLSSQQLFVSSINGAPLINSSFVQSTVIGLGSVGYVSTLSLISTTLGLQQSGFLSSPNLLNLVSTPNLLNLISTQGLSTVLYSTITSLGSFGYVSTSQLVSTTFGLQTSGFLSSPNLLNLVSTSYLSTVLYSTITNLGSFGYMSSVVSSFLTLSTGTQTTSTTRYIDTLNTNSTYNVYVRSTFLYFNNYIVGGVTQLQPQIFNF